MTTNDVRWIKYQQGHGLVTSKPEMTIFEIQTSKIHTQPLPPPFTLEGLIHVYSI